MTTTHDELIRRAQSIARVEDEKRARRWLTTACSILADWGGSSAKSILGESLPSGCLSGKGSKGRSWDVAQKDAGGDPRIAITREAEIRSRQEDPRNAAMMLRALLGLVKQEVLATKGQGGLDALIASLPAPVQDEVRGASTLAPYAYRLIPQSYARPHGPQGAHDSADGGR
jgi:hypothetical protein